MQQIHDQQKGEAMKETAPCADRIVLHYGTTLYAAEQVDHRLLLNNSVQFNESMTERGNLARRIAIHILEHASPTTFTYEEPTTWFQMLKRDVLPRWFSRRFPIQSHTPTVEMKNIHPFICERLPETFGPCITYATIRKTSWMEEG